MVYFYYLVSILTKIKRVNFKHFKIIFPDFMKILTEKLTKKINSVFKTDQYNTKENS